MPRSDPQLTSTGSGSFLARPVDLLGKAAHDMVLLVDDQLRIVDASERVEKPFDAAALRRLFARMLSGAGAPG